MESDRIRWNLRYDDGSYGTRQHPTALLKTWLKRLPHSSALDLACGTGRNARFIAQTADEVVGIDISDVAIEKARSLASKFENIKFATADLDQGIPLIRQFELIVVIRFVDMRLLSTLSDHIVTGGAVLVEEHLQWSDESLDLAGPMSLRFRVKPGDLAGALKDFEPLYSFEGLIHDPDGKPAAVSQFIGLKTK